MMDLRNSVKFCRLLLILLGLVASLALAKPRDKSDPPRGSGRIRGETSTVNVGGSRRRSHHWRRVTSPTSERASRLLSEYKLEIARKIARVRTPEEFMRVFFPVDSIKSRWTKMVNESLQIAWRARGRRGDAADSDHPAFTESMADEAMAEINRHTVKVQCREPKPVLIDMYEELNLKRGEDHPFPECTLVRRCEGSGCCPGGHRCVGNENTRENITSPFIIVSESPDGKHKGSRYIEHLLYADTECLCRERARSCQPTDCPDAMTFNEAKCECECSKRCPKPFILDPDTCDCECADNDGVCNKIKRSKRRMSTPECGCVMDDQCFQPACKKGYEFVPRSCKCILKDDKRDSLDRNRGSGRTDGQEQPPPPRKSGRTNYGPAVPMPSSSDAETAQFSSSDPGDDQNTSMVEEGLMVTWEWGTLPSEDCGGSTCLREGVQGYGSGGSDGGD